MPTLAKCPACQHTVSSTAEACPGCGHKLPKRTTPRTLIFGGLFAFIVIAFIASMPNEANEKARVQHEREARVNDAIAGQKIFVGMTTDEARASWGEPERVNTSGTATAIREQWVYPGGQYLHFTNGKLTSWSGPR